MRFKLDWDENPPRWLSVPIVVVTAPVWLVFIGMLWLETTIRSIKRKLLGPRVGEWQRWFAWRPVTLDNGWGETVWLETVYRQALGSSYGYGVAYVLEIPEATK